MHFKCKQIVVLAVITVLLCTVPLIAEEHGEEAPADVIVEVNGEQYGEEELDRELSFMAMQFQMDPADMPEDQRHQMEAMARENIIQRAILMRYVEEEEVALDEESQQMMQMIMGQMTQDPQMEQNLEAMGMTMEEMQDYMEDQMMIEQLVNDWIEEVEITDEQIEEYYEQSPEEFAQVHARHILLEVPEGADEEAWEARRAEAEEVLERLEEEDFAEVAAEVSDCPSGQQQGGDLGEFGPGQMDPQFEQVAFDMAPGETKVADSSFGVHIIEVLDHKDSLDDVREDVKQMIQFEAGDRIFQEKIEEGREKFDVTEY